MKLMITGASGQLGIELLNQIEFDKFENDKKSKFINVI